MSSSLRRGVIAATAVALSIASLAACGAGNDAQTNDVQPDNASITIGDIKIQSVNFVTQPDGDGRATLTARLFNEGTENEVLTAITLPGSTAQVRLTPAEGTRKVVVPAGGALAIGGEGNAVVEINGGVVEGDAQPVVFDLSSTGEVRLKATVVPATGVYEGYGPSALPSAPENPAESGEPAPGEETSPGGTPSPGGTDEAHASPSAPDASAGASEQPDTDAHAGH